MRNKRWRIILWLAISLFTAGAATYAYQRFTGAEGSALSVSMPDLSLNPIGSLFGKSDADENTILIYSAMLESQVQEYITAFRAQHPDIMVQYEMIDTVELSERILKEKDNPQADVIWGMSATMLQELAWKDTLLPYAPIGLESLPDQFRDDKNPPAWVGQDIWMNAFCVNTNVLKKANVPAPQSWEDLLEPRYENMIAYPNPANSGTGYMSLLALLSIFGEVNIWNKLDQLHANVATYDLSPGKACKAAADGEVGIGISYGLAAVDQYSNGAPITIVFPSEGSGWEMEASALTRKLPTNPNAKILMDYIISEDAMHHYGLHYAVTAVPVDYLVIPAGFPKDPRAQLIERDYIWEGANRRRLISEWEVRYITEE